MVNVATVTSVPHELTPPVSLVVATKSTDSINPKPIPLQCAMCRQPKSSHPSAVPIMALPEVLVVLSVIILSSVAIALKQSTSNTTHGNNNKRKKDNNQKKRRKSEDSSSSEEENSIKLKT